MPEITEHTATIADQPVFWLQAQTDATPVVYVHGVPSSSEDWRPFLERTGGFAPDLAGFGRSGKRADLPYDLDFYDRWLEAWLDAAGIDRFRLLVHDWGGLGLLPAMRRPERVERLVVTNAVTYSPNYRWHSTARMWRRRVVGEVSMGAMVRPVARRALRKAFTGPVPDRFLDDIFRFFDTGTQRSILKLYRASPESLLATRQPLLKHITCPALVVWGDRDPYIAPPFADEFAAALGSTDVTVEHVPDAGHWVWLDRPDYVGVIADFLTAP